MRFIHTLLTAFTASAALAGPVAQQLTFMTGPQGGVWVPLGGALKGMWEKAIPGLQVTAGRGIANVRGVGEDKAQIGFGNTITTVDGIEGRPPYPKKVTKVCQLATLYPQYFQVWSWLAQRSIRLQISRATPSSCNPKAIRPS